ncbi:zygote arrest protein 1 [Clinocottus analis]|uniref:zygote arrest protein 1 n=1 Tax=Clinocottus analis TaxID=304258 RepID=UPI0035BFBACC
MATYGDEPVDGYFFSSCAPYGGRYPRAKAAGGWRCKSYLSHCGDAADAFNNHQRAQLKSILSQINPKLTPRLRKANTKDVAVQVNPRCDAAVQCGLGPRTLLAWKRDSGRRRRQEAAAAPAASHGSGGSGSPKTPGGGVRYPRTLAVYSPIAYRSVTSFLVDENNNNNNPNIKEASCGAAPPADPPDSAGTRAAKKTEKLAEPRGGTGTSKQRESDELLLRAAEGSKGKARVRFQFLEQKYGYYHCRECNLRWESAYVWCVQGTNKVYFKQFCRKCQKDFNPYRVEDITCHTCNKARCSCSVTQRHVDPKRPHRQDLCGRCKGKRLSCESTFSFKYII